MLAGRVSLASIAKKFVASPWGREGMAQHVVWLALLQICSKPSGLPHCAVRQSWPSLQTRLQ